MQLTKISCIRCFWFPVLSALVLRMFGQPFFRLFTQPIPPVKRTRGNRQNSKRKHHDYTGECDCRIVYSAFCARHFIDKVCRAINERSAAEETKQRILRDKDSQTDHYDGNCHSPTEFHLLLHRDFFFPRYIPKPIFRPFFLVHLSSPLHTVKRHSAYIPSSRLRMLPPLLFSRRLLVSDRNEVQTLPPMKCPYRFSCTLLCACISHGFPFQLSVS